MLIGVIGYSSALFGFLSGAALTVLVGAAHDRARAVLQGFCSGIFLAFVCFTILPEAFARSATVGVSCAFAGTLLSAWVDRHSKTAATVFTVGIMLHGIPEGVALGSVLRYDFTAGLYMALLLAVHCLPESMILFGHLRERRCRSIFLRALLLAVPVGIGTALGVVLEGAFSSLCLAFAGGIMIYLACGGVFPEEGQSRYGIAAAILGFGTGVFLL